jgi:hypothetical protein
VAALTNDPEPAVDMPAVARASTAARTLEVNVLGTVSIVDAGVRLPAESLPSGKGLELLLFLLLHRGATRDEVGLALWPDASAAQVRNVFHVTMHHLRRALGATRWITFERNVYRIDRAPEPGRTLDLDVDAVLEASAQLRALLRARPSADPAPLAALRAFYEKGMLVKATVVALPANTT